MSNDPRRWPLWAYVLLVASVGGVTFVAVNSVFPYPIVLIPVWYIAGYALGSIHTGPDDDNDDPQDRVPPKYR